MQDQPNQTSPIIQDFRRAAKQKYDGYLRWAFSAGHLAAVRDGVPAHVLGAIDAVYDAIKPGRSPNTNTAPCGAVVMGAVGCGKTSLMAMFCRKYADDLIEHFVKICGDEIYRVTDDGVLLRDKNMKVSSITLIQAFPIRFLTHSEMVRLLREESKEKEIDRNYGGDQILNSRILIIDDFGRGYDDRAGWNLALQEEFFDERWKRRMPTLITTNLTPNELRARPGWERTVDRLADPTWLRAIAMGGKSRRV